MNWSLWRGLAWLALLWLAASAPARAEWRRAESPNFVIYSEESEARLRERITMLEEFDNLLRLMTGISSAPSPNRLPVYIVGGLDDLRILRDFGSSVAGFYTATPSGIAAFVDGDVPARSRASGSRWRSDANEILFHEYAHHFMWQYAASAYPAWYVEGFAEYFATAQLRGQSIDIGTSSVGRGWAVVEGNWLPIERLLFGDGNGLNNLQTGQFYAQSWLLTHYFYSTPERQEAFRRYLAAIQRDGNRGETLQAATGLTPQALHEELRRYIRSGRIHYRRITFETARQAPQVTVTVLPRSAEDLLLYDAALRIGVNEDKRAERLERIRAAANRHPDDPYARRVLAHAELLFGDRTAAERLLDGLLAASPNDAELLYLRGMLHLTAAEKGDDWEAESLAARRWFTRAHRADENHFQTLFRFAQSLRGDPNYVSENTSNVLLLAHQLAPQVAEIRLNAAAMLISRRDIETAEALLRPLAADPHNAALAQAAREMIERARSSGNDNRPALEAGAEEQSK